MNLNLLIPMAGKGSRFKEAKYETFKPFIKINQHNMYEYVTNKFPKEVKIWVITCKEYLKSEHINNLKKKKINILYISPHKLGPAYTIWCCKNHLPLNESFFISYCDIDWSWNFSQIKKYLFNDGIVFTNKGFHPHKLINNYSAFCRTKKNQLIKIKEKESFTTNWIEEDLSVGVFYIKNGYDMIGSIESLMKKKITVSNEYFPSLIFNELLNEKKKIVIHRLEYFIHWGIPDYLEDYLSWYKKILKIRKFKFINDFKNTLIVCMAGKSKRIKKLNLGNKAFIKINYKPMFKFVSDFFPNNKRNVVISTLRIFKENSKYFKNYEKVILNKQTNSQIETLKKSIKHLEKRKNFFLLSCDAFGFFNLKTFKMLTEETGVDVIIFVFDPSLIQKSQKDSHTYVSFKRGTISSINIKKRIRKDDLGLAGFFWFKNGEIFSKIKKINLIQGQEIVVDHFIQLLLENNISIKAIKLDHYFHLGTIDELNEFKFWNIIFKKNYFNSKSNN